MKSMKPNFDTSQKPLFWTREGRKFLILNKESVPVVLKMGGEWGKILKGGRRHNFGSTNKSKKNDDKKLNKDSKATE